ncbi:activating transcription factor 7-interacting protein 1 [Anopheles moucheti]|uniref:activating transcription factor 7-interacting protein 1 n=1 Tax=Anopheles moucheti TaxID=186751 RepID=UPI0022EFDF64|nr:activating transcription factor 7-interacting protein 1 [Anopheles moucheti]XP_052897291.1 activating transcription factor 7-interacting protein 1 [Anopheles moucheti]
MMDVDQPVSSTTEAESSPTSQETAPEKSPGMIVRENDDLPALLISDSEEDEAPKVATEEKKTEDISGITPIETTVPNANDKCDDTGNETTICSTLTTQETSALSAADGEEISLVENIDLTGASSAEDSGVNEPSSERMTTPSKVKTPVPSKPSSEMTAQELLESLLEAQEEAFASQRASSNAEKELAEATQQSKAANNMLTASKTEKTSGSNLDCKVGEIAKESTNQGAANQDENGSKMDTIVVDDECLLEEMVNALEGQQEMDIDEDRTGSNNSLCSDDGSGANHKSDGAEQASALESNDNFATLSEKRDNKNCDDALQCSEPPRKRARSMATDPEPQLKTDSAFRGIENDTIKNGKASEESGEKTELQTERLNLHSEIKTNLSSSESKSAGASLDKSKAAMMIGSSDTPNDSNGSLDGGSQKKQCILEGGQKNVHAIETSVCPEVLVIDDDDDEAEETSNEAVDTNDKKSDVSPENNLLTDQHSETSVQNADEDPKSAASVAAEKMEATPMAHSTEGEMETSPTAMEFLRRFNKPISLMTRSDLEQLVLQKISEAIVHQGENAELRKIIKRQSAKLQGYERTIFDMSSHYDGLKLVAERAVEDMKKRAKCFVAPVKITRAVGLQVSRPAMEMTHSNKPWSSYSKIVPEKQNNLPVTGTVVTNGTIENRAQSSKANEPANKPSQLTTGPFPSGQQNTSSNVIRSQLSNNVSPMAAARITPNSPMTNGMTRTVNSQAGKLSNSTATTTLNTTVGNTVKMAPVPNNGGPGTSIANTARFTNPLTNTSPAANRTAGGMDSTVRKKFHKFTPKRPPLSPYQQAQQEKQVRQQQELLVQQIHEQSQQAQQRKPQVNVRTDLLTVDGCAALTALDAATRQRTSDAAIQQGRPLNANVQMSVPQSYQAVPLGGTRATPIMINSTTIQLTEVKSNSSQPTRVSSSANDSLIDLTDEDDITAVKEGLHSSILVKRVKPSQGDSITATTSSQANNPGIASNQFQRTQPRINTLNGSEIAPTVASSAAAGDINQFNNAIVRAPLNVNRSNNPLQPSRHPTYNSNLSRPPASSTDVVKKRVLIKPVLAPLPPPGPQPSDPTWKLSPPQPSICVNNVQAGIVISWTMPSLTDLHADIETYQIYAYQELSMPTSLEEWRHVGDVKALLLPMAVTLTQFQEGQRYYFAVRAIDVHKRVGKFCDPRTWNETNVSNV